MTFIMSASMGGCILSNNNERSNKYLIWEVKREVLIH